MYYRNYRLLKKLFSYENDLAHQLQRMAKKIAVLMKNRTFSGRDPMSVIGFLQEIKSSFDACEIHESTVMWLFKQVLAVPAGAAVSARVTLTNSARFYHEGALNAYSAIVQLLLKR